LEHNKKFLVIGNMNAIGYKEIFPHIKNNEMWLGTQYVKEFVSDSGETKKFGNILWYTNLDHKKRHEEIILYKKYNEAEYPKYDNYDAIEVSKVADIPFDYEGIMGVPITFLDKYCPDQFEIIGIAEGDSGKELGLKPFPPELKKLNPSLRQGQLYYMEDGYPVKPYARILIRKKQTQ
jgi:hypothetical protein